MLYERGNVFGAMRYPHSQQVNVLKVGYLKSVLLCVLTVCGRLKHFNKEKPISFTEIKGSLWSLLIPAWQQENWDKGGGESGYKVGDVPLP